MIDPRSETRDDEIDRRQYWQRRLGRLRLGAEPIEEQLERYRRATWALTLVPLSIGAIIIAILTTFGAPAIGISVFCILFCPIIAIAWLDFRRLSARAREYLREHAE